MRFELALRDALIALETDGHPLPFLVRLEGQQWRAHVRLVRLTPKVAAEPVLVEGAKEDAHIPCDVEVSDNSANTILRTSSTELAGKWTGKFPFEE